MSRTSLVSQTNFLTLFRECLATRHIRNEQMFFNYSENLVKGNERNGSEWNKLQTHKRTRKMNQNDKTKTSHNYTVCYISGVSIFFLFCCLFVCFLFLGVIQLRFLSMSRVKKYRGKIYLNLMVVYFTHICCSLPLSRGESAGERTNESERVRRVQCAHTCRKNDKPRLQQFFPSHLSGSAHARTEKYFFPSLSLLISHFEFILNFVASVLDQTHIYTNELL